SIHCAPRSTAPRLRAAPCARSTNIAVADDRFRVLPPRLGRTPRRRSTYYPLSPLVDHNSRSGGAYSGSARWIRCRLLRRALRPLLGTGGTRSNTAASNSARPWLERAGVDASETLPAFVTRLRLGVVARTFCV